MQRDKSEGVRNLNLMDELIEALLNGNDEITYVFNQQTKEVLIDMPEGITGESGIDWDDDETTEFLVRIPQMTSSEAYDLMVSFAKRQNVEVSSQLLDVLDGRKPFRSFKDKIKGQGIENEWYDFENDYAKNEMLAWLEQYK